KVASLTMSLPPWPPGATLKQPSFTSQRSRGSSAFLKPRQPLALLPSKSSRQPPRTSSAVSSPLTTGLGPHSRTSPSAAPTLATPRAPTSPLPTAGLLRVVGDAPAAPPVPPRRRPAPAPASGGPPRRSPGARRRSAPRVRNPPSPGRGPAAQCPWDSHRRRRPVAAGPPSLPRPPPPPPRRSGPAPRPPAAHHLLAFDLDAPQAAVDLHAVWEPGGRRRRRQQGAEGAVLEAQRRRQAVLDLDLVGQGGHRAGTDLLHVAQEPQQQVDQVDALVHQGAASVEGPAAAPAGAAVALGA